VIKCQQSILVDRWTIVKEFLYYKKYLEDIFNNDDEVGDLNFEASRSESFYIIDQARVGYE